MGMSERQSTRTAAPEPLALLELWELLCSGLELLQALEEALDEGQRLVIDLDFEDKMSESEIKSLCQQLSYAYGANTKAVVPCHFVFTSLKGRMRDHITRQLTGFENWVSTQTEQDYMQHFGDKAVGQLVYLTADSPDEITELDPAKAYIIGGLVDRNRYKGLCYQKAQEQGIATARLPIGEFMKLASSQVMTTNHVVDIILRWLELRDWEAAFNAVIPTRKRKHEEATEADDNGNLEDRPHKQQQQQQQHETRVEACGGADQAAAAGAVASQGRAQDGEAGPSPNAAAVPAQGGEGGQQDQHAADEGVAIVADGDATGGTNGLGSSERQREQGEVGLAAQAASS